MASLIENGQDFEGSEVVLVDLDPQRLELIRTIAERMASVRGLDLVVSATTDRRAALTDCDAVLSSFRPGGFTARVFDERIPLNHGVIGQETQGPGGFFMALRAIAVLQQGAPNGGAVPGGRTTTTPTRSTSSPRQSLSTHRSRWWSLCEGPILLRRVTSLASPNSANQARGDDGGASTTAAGASNTATRAAT